MVFYSSCCYIVKLVGTDFLGSEMEKDAYVVCRIFQKSGAGPRNGAQYGAPFIEEEWEEEEDEKAADGLFVTPFGGDAEINEALNSEFMEINDLLQVRISIMIFFGTVVVLPCRHFFN